MHGSWILCKVCVEEGRGELWELHMFSNGLLWGPKLNKSIAVFDVMTINSIISFYLKKNKYEKYTFGNLRRRAHPRPLRGDINKWGDRWKPIVSIFPSWPYSSAVVSNEHWRIRHTLLLKLVIDDLLRWSPTALQRFPIPGRLRQCRRCRCFELWFCLFVWGFTSHSRIFHSYGDVTITGWRLKILT